MFNQYEDIVTLLYKKEDQKRFNTKIKNMKSTIDTNNKNYTKQNFSNFRNRNKNLFLEQCQSSGRVNLMKIFDKGKKSNSIQSRKKSPNLDFKKLHRAAVIKNEIKTIAQENLYMLKKLINQTSEYKREYFEKKYQESQKYKSLLCHYPSIDFNITRFYKKPKSRQNKMYHQMLTEGNLPSIRKVKEKYPSLDIKKGLKYNILSPKFFKEATKNNGKLNILNIVFHKPKGEKKNKDIENVTHL